MFLNMSMSSKFYHSSAYPGGYIRYVFKMHVAHNMSIRCPVAHLKLKEIVFEKVNSVDEFDPAWHMTLYFGAVNSIDEVDEIGNVIKDDIFDVLSLILNIKIDETKLVGHGLTPRLGEGGICIAQLPLIECNSIGKCGGVKLSSQNIQEIQDFVKIPQHKPLINLFRHAISTENPVVQFMMLYLILDEIYEHNQTNIDANIMKIAPNTCQTFRPDKLPNKEILETTYTRLRNEITHRIGNHPEDTRDEILKHLYKFKIIVHSAIKLKVFFL